MALNDVPIQSSVHQHATLDIHLVAHLQQAEVGTLQGFTHGGDDIGAVLNADNCQTHAIVCHTLVNAQLVDKRAAQRKVNIVSVFSDSYDGSKLFYNT